MTRRQPTSALAPKPAMAMATAMATATATVMAMAMVDAARFQRRTRADHGWR
jgi:hypothetical protein